MTKEQQIKQAIEKKYSVPLRDGEQVKKAIEEINDLIIDVYLDAFFNLHPEFVDNVYRVFELKKEIK
jgi:hypothetical protein